MAYNKLNSLLNRSSMHQAFGVLNEVAKILKNKTAYITSYSNGREQGFTIIDSNFDKKGIHYTSIMWSECRNSDSIVVYVNNSYNGDNGIPTEEAYADAKYFDYMEYREAAKYIVSELK